MKKGNHGREIPAGATRTGWWSFALGAAVALLTISHGRAQYLGVTCGYDYGRELTGPYNAATNLPLYNPVASNPNATWAEWAAQLKQSGVDFVCPNLEGSQPNTSKNPTNIAACVTALNNAGNVTKVALFDDNATSWVAQNSQANGQGFGTSFQFDISDTNNWKYIYDWNYKLFYQTVPDANRFKVNGRPLIIIWTGNKVFLTNMQGNVSKALTYVRQKCQSDFGFNPYIVLSQDFFGNDTTCSNSAIADAGEHWYVPPGQPSTLQKNLGVPIGALAPSYHDPSQANYMPGNHGATLENGLIGTVNAGALLTLCEGFTDWAEEATLLRVRNVDANGNALSYNQTFYDYPNQRIDLLRKYSTRPFPTELTLEAEGCDYYGGASGGNGQTNYFRNGNIAIEPTTDAGGGWDVGWINPGEWLEWEQVPIEGSNVWLQVRVACFTNNAQLHFVIDGTNYPAMALPNTYGRQIWTTVSSGPYAFPKNGSHVVRVVCDTAGFNLNYWRYEAQIPLGVNINLKAASNSQWVTVTNGGALNASATSPGLSGVFTVVDASAGDTPGCVALLALTNGLYVTAYTNGATSLAADSPTVGPAQIFEWTDNGDGTVALTAFFNSMLVSVTNKPSQYPLAINVIRGVGPAQSFTVIPVSSNTLSFVAQPNAGQAMTAITAGALNEVQVLAMNSSNVPVAGATITLSLSSGTGTVSGNTATTDGSGIAHFTNLEIDTVGAKTLVASSPVFTRPVSAAFNIIGGAAARLNVESQPDGNGVPVAAQTVSAGSSVRVYGVTRDAYSNYVANVPATWSLINLTGGVVGSDLAPASDSLSATLTGHVQGTAVIRAAGVFTNQTGIQTVVAGPATSLSMSQQPSATAKIGAPFAQQPVVTEKDVFGNFSLTPITATESGGVGNVNGNPAGITITPVNGVGSFSGLYLTNLGTSTLTFTAGGAATQSASIVTSIGNAEQLIWTTQPGNASTGRVFGISPSIATADAGGNLSAAGLPAVKMVSVSVYSGGGSLLGTTLTNIGSGGGNGFITLTNLSINATGTFQLIARDLGNAVNPTNFSAAASCQLWLDAADASTIVGTNGISQWNDKSGHTNNAMGAAALNTNTMLSPSSPGQGHTIYFNGSQQLTMNLSSLSNSPYTILVMDVGGAKSSGSSYFIGNTGGYGQDLTLGVGYQSSSQFRWQQYSDDLNYNASFAAVTPRQWTLNLNPTPVKNLYLNSTLAGTSPSSFLKGTSLVNGTVGYNSYLGDIAEIIVYNSSLSAQDQANLQSYLNNKWLTGLSSAISQPFTVTPPVYLPLINSCAVQPGGGALSSFVFMGNNGPTNGSYRILASTNLAAKTSTWTPILTNTFDGGGAFSNAILIDPLSTLRYYRLAVP